MRRRTNGHPVAIHRPPSAERDGSREYQDVYRVISDDPNEPALNVRTASGIPTLWQAHPDGAAICTGRSARRIDDSRLVWEVTATFQWRPTDTDDEDENPLDRAPKIRWTSQLVTKPVLKDRNGDACVNSAGDYFDPPLEAEYPRWIVNIQFIATVVPSGILSYPGAINSSSVTIDGIAVAAERARVVGLDISEIQRHDTGSEIVLYRSITLAVEVRHANDDPFDIEALDQGFRIKEDDELKDILIEDEDGNKSRPSSPVLLDGAGGKLEDPSPENAEFLTFETVARQDFTVFPGIGS
ncbi:MAG: hypothetical protein KF861_11060 [Planctomycetaceae bacterium]|nr:hypothetical protein [Planctomycetaceae bacterium]